ncbi:MAG: hypothetical protein B6I24_01240 [Bacteroidetes bacterium 4572_128]|nr:MAG: hypothetical protein B6I24_01240 [Bacteroidetes bacterium 4572_128]
MGIFDFFKKKDKEHHYDVTNLQITDLQKKFLIDYDLKTWEVKDVFEYDWGKNNFSMEYQLECEDDTIYLHIEKDDDLELTISKKIRISSIEEKNVKEHILNTNEPPKILHYKGIEFYLEEEATGYYRNIDNPRENSQEFISWDYYDKKEKYILNVEQWGEREFDASFGKVIKEFEFSNIIPAI